jgi:hypothetical protein
MNPEPTPPQQQRPARETFNTGTTSSKTFVVVPMSPGLTSLAMATPDSSDALPRSVTDEKHKQVQHEYLARDESPDTIVNKKKEGGLRRKLDGFVAPVMMLMLISYIDRGNVGFAATQGMTTDIKLKCSELNER